MRRFLALALTLILSTTVLAGCTKNNAEDDGQDEIEPTPTTPTPTTQEPTPTTTTPVTPTTTPTPPTTPVLDSSTYAIAVSGQPTQALPGAAFNFTMFVNGSIMHESDHVGAHISSNDTTNPPGAGRQDCEHTIAQLPGTFLVNCTIANEGTWYVWGHARINDTGELRNWWSPTPFVVKVRNYNLTLSDAPTNPPTSKQNFTVKLNVTGVDNATSDHIDIHFWNATTTTPALATAAGNCAQVAEPTGAIGVFTITCSIENTGIAGKDYYLRGHLRLTEGATTLDWWSAELKVSVLGIPSTPLP